MKFFRSIKDDFQAHRNLEYYITLVAAIPIALLGIFGTVNPATTASATLAVLALVAFGLLQNRRENDNILKVISTTENLDARIQALSQHLGRTFQFIRTDASNRLAKGTVRSLIDQASREVLILDYNPLPLNMFRNSPDDIMSDDRRNYYDTLSKNLPIASQVSFVTSAFCSCRINTTLPTFFPGIAS